MTNLGFNSGVGFIPLISSFRKKNTISIAFFLVTLGNPFTVVTASLVPPIIPTLTMLGNGLKGADEGEGFFLIISGLGIGGSDGY